HLFPVTGNPNQFFDGQALTIQNDCHLYLAKKCLTLPLFAGLNFRIERPLPRISRIFADMEKRIRAH
ncbi:hypothetical protein JZU51_01610, partial [bacterium]|nr:hypothetical protein [bacterium]